MREQLDQDEVERKRAKAAEVVEMMRESVLRDIERNRLADHLMTASMVLLIGGMTVGFAIMVARLVLAGAYATAVLPGFAAAVFGLMAAAFFVGIRK